MADPDFTNKQIDALCALRPAIREHFGSLLDNFKAAVSGFADEQHRGFSWNFEEREAEVERCRETLEKFLEALI